MLSQPVSYLGVLVHDVVFEVRINLSGRLSFLAAACTFFSPGLTTPDQSSGLVE